MAAHGLTPITLQSSQRSSYSVGAELMGEVLANHPDTDALFCTNDDVAVGEAQQQRQSLQQVEHLPLQHFGEAPQQAGVAKATGAVFTGAPQHGDAGLEIGAAVSHQR